MVNLTTFISLCITTVISIIYTSYLLITEGLSTETTGWCLFSLLSIAFIMHLISVVKIIHKYSYVLETYKDRAR
jgi:hypothetical protein